MGIVHAFNSEITTFSTMKISVLTKEAYSYNPSTYFYETNSGLWSLSIKSKKGKQIGFIRIIGYHEHICGVELVFPKKVLQRYLFYFIVTIISSKTSAAIYVYMYIGIC